MEAGTKHDICIFNVKKPPSFPPVKTKSSFLGGLSEIASTLRSSLIHRKSLPRFKLMFFNCFISGLFLGTVIYPYSIFITPFPATLEATKIGDGWWFETFF